MTEEQTTLLLIKGALSEFGADEQQKVNACADQLRSILEANGKHGLWALGLVGAELAAKA